MDKVAALGFVLCAVVATFVSMHKEEIEKGEFEQVVASYIDG
ncbi:hypothetical protein [Halovulum sp. GXIMD14793]